jgi:hypothetical protein
MLHVLGLQDLANARYYSRGGQPLRAPKFRGVPRGPPRDPPRVPKFRGGYLVRGVLFRGSIPCIHLSMSPSPSFSGAT